MKRASCRVIALSWCLASVVQCQAAGAQGRAAATLQSRVVLTCDAVREINRDLEKLSREELKAHIHTQLRDSTKSRQRESYILCKYYGCRYPDDPEQTAGYMRDFVKKYEKAAAGYYLRRMFVW